MKLVKAVLDIFRVTPPQDVQDARAAIQHDVEAAAEKQQQAAERLARQLKELGPIHGAVDLFGRGKRREQTS